MQRYKALAASVLNGAINNSQTSLVVASAVSFPTSGEFYVLIDSELILVTGVSGTTFTGTRAQDGTVAASHLNNATVSHVATKAFFFKFREDNYQSGTYASLSTPAIDGRFGLTNDSVHLIQDRSSVINHRGPIHKMTPPQLGNFSWHNQDAATANNNNVFLHLTSPSNNTGVSINILEQTPPSPPYTLIAYLLGNRHPLDFMAFGVCHRETSSSKIVSLHSANSSGEKFEHVWWNNATSFNQLRQQIVPGFIGAFCPWFRIEHTGSQLKYSISPDKYSWRVIAIDNLTSFFTTAPDRIGLMIQVGQPGTGYTQALSCLDWSVQ